MLYGVSIVILSIVCFSLLSWYLAYDFVSCNVVGAGLTSANGYYSAIGGVYFKRGGDNIGIDSRVVLSVVVAL